MAQGIVRETKTPDIYTEAPPWMLHVMNNAAAYGTFYLDLTQGIHRCETQVTDFLSAGKADEAKVMLGKREALMEMRFLLEAYRTEEERNNDRQS